jgi:hypothetical protein
MNRKNYNDIKNNDYWSHLEDGVIVTLKCTNMHPDVCMLEYNKFLYIILYLNVLEE